VTTLPVGITLEEEYHNYKLRGKKGRFRLKYRNLELARKGKRYPLYIFLSSGDSRDLNNINDTVFGVMGVRTTLHKTVLEVVEVQTTLHNTMLKGSRDCAEATEDLFITIVIHA
jgi:hypothetical protein